MPADGSLGRSSSRARNPRRRPQRDPLPARGAQVRALARNRRPRQRRPSPYGPGPRRGTARHARRAHASSAWAHVRVSSLTPARMTKPRVARRHPLSATGALQAVRRASAEEEHLPAPPGCDWAKCILSLAFAPGRARPEPRGERRPPLQPSSTTSSRSATGRGRLLGRAARRRPPDSLLSKGSAMSPTTGCTDAPGSDASSSARARRSPRPSTRPTGSGTRWQHDHLYRQLLTPAIFGVRAFSRGSRVKCDPPARRRAPPRDAANANHGIAPAHRTKLERGRPPRRARK